MEKPKNVYVHTTHGHELRGGNTGGRAVPGGGGYRGEKKWDNSNSIINKT